MSTWPATHTYLFSSHGKRRIEPLLEGAAALEDGGQQEVEKCPEFRELVLQRCARQQQAAGGHVVRVEDLCQLTVVVLHAMAFVHDHVLPTDLQAQEQVFSGSLQDETLTATRQEGSWWKSPSR